MLNKEKILEIEKIKGTITTVDITALFKVSRQYANSLIGELVAEQKLIKVGNTKKSFYFLPEYAKKHPELLPIHYAKSFKNVGIAEHKILDEIEKKLPALNKLEENVQNIFSYNETVKFMIERAKTEARL